MRRFYLVWPSSEIFQTPSERSSTLPELATRFPLPSSGYVRLLSVKNTDARSFYETEALRAGWSVRQLDRQIGSMFYERIALSRNKMAMLEKAESAKRSDAVPTEEATEDPFVLEFLNLKGEYSESDLEEALIQHLTEFLLELGDDNPPVGLMLCAEKGAAEARYALDNLHNKVLAAEYQTVLPDERFIAEELDRSRQKARGRQSGIKKRQYGMSKRGMATIGDKMGPSDLKRIRQSKIRNREDLGMTSRYHDLKIAVRHFLKSRGFVATAVLMLA